MNKDDISGGFKLLLSVVFGISFIAFAASIVNSVFSFSGAVIRTAPFLSINPCTVTRMSLARNGSRL